MPTGISLHIGLNSVDPNHYKDEHGKPWNGALKAPQTDAINMRDLAKAQGFRPTLLRTREATSDRLKQELQKAAKQLKAGDIFMFTYSGHGGQDWDMSGDEPANEATSPTIPQVTPKDETLCLYDRNFRDDELNYQFSQFADGVRILALMDCCHSGTNVRNLEQEDQSNLLSRGIDFDINQQIIERNRGVYDQAWGNKQDFLKTSSRLKNSVLLLAACQESQLAQETGYDDGSDWQGAFTRALLATWNQGNFQGNYRQFFNQIAQQIKVASASHVNWHQTPNYLLEGTANPEFERQKPFTI